MQIIMVTLVSAVKSVNMQKHSGFIRKNIQGHSALLLLQ
jgi:hypothetical protein